jgi:hypothetical protein
MPEEPFQVRTEELRDAADELTGTACRLGHGLVGAPGLTVPAPGWAAARALAALESALHSWLGTVGGRLAQTATALGVAADGYDAADDRAARRLASADTGTGAGTDTDTDTDTDTGTGIATGIGAGAG